MLDSLSAIYSGTRSPRLRRIIDSIREDVSSGTSLGEALARTGLFPQKFVALIMIGEEAGKLSENLRVISRQQQKEQEFNAKVRSAMMYPLFVVIMGAIIAVSLAWFLLPKLAVVFRQLNVTLPPMTQALINIGDFFKDYGLIFFPIFLILFGAFIYFLFFDTRTRHIGYSIIFRIPGMKDLLKHNELARFGYIFGTMLSAGLPISQALLALQRATPFNNFRKFYAYLQQRISDGHSFQTSFVAYKKIDRLIPAPLQQLILAGEKSGRLPQVLLKTAEIYEVKLDNTAKNFGTMIEPALLFIVWIGVMLLAVSIVMPIYSLVGNINK
jgi:type IV pilus assembly protein PilC